MKQIGKRILSMLCVLTMLLSMAAVIVPGPYTAEATSTNEIDAISSEHLISVRDYSDFATEEGKTAYVDDAEAFGGKAVCYSKANFDGGDFLAIKRYDSGKEVNIKQMFKEDLHINDGYHIYKIEYDVPADATEGSVFFIMPNWQLNSAQFCKDFGPYAGKTVEVYLSIKVTKNTADDLYSVSVDRVALASVCEDYMGANGVCTLCGDGDVVDVLEGMIPSEHLAVERDYSFFGTEDGKTAYVDDAEAFGGKAVCYSKANFDNGDFIGIHRYESATSVDESIAQLFLADLKVDQGYQIYKFTYDVPANATENGVVYIMPNWQLNSSQLCKDIYAYAGKTVELYFSMKITGPAEDGLYSVSVDRVAIATVCKDYIGADGVCTLCGTGDALQSMFPAEHLVSQRDHSYFATEDGKTAYVDDAEAFGGKAVCYSKATLDASIFISINRYDVASGLSAADLRIGELGLNELKIDQGYQIYKFTYDVPAATTEGNVFYIMNNWQLNSAQFCKDFAACAGKTVEVYISMKITGPVAGLYSIFVDRVALATVCEDHASEDGTVCTVCGKELNTENEETSGVVFLADDITLPYYTAGLCDTKLDDPDSQYGKAIKMSYAERFATGDAGLWKPMLYTAEQAMLIYANNGTDTRLGMITGAEMQENSAAGQYVTYTFEDLDLSGQNFVYLFDWSVQTRFSEEQKNFFAGKLVDMTVSMKVTGDVTGADAANPPVYYIDCIRFTEAEAHTHTCPEFTYADEKQHSGSCSDCGETVTENHAWDDGVITEKPTLEKEGEITYTCTVCNGTKTEVLDKLTEADVTLTFLAEDVNLPYFAAGLCDSIVDDPDSQYGKAIKLSYTERFATGDAGLWKHMLYTAEQAMLIYSNDGSDTRLGMITGAEMQENSAAGQYVTYTFEDLDLSGQNFVYLFDWSVQTRFSEEQKNFFAGKLVNMTLSMKVTGDVTGTDAANPPAYYIDCISYTLAEEKHTHTCPEYTFVDEEEHTGVCSECGETVIENHAWDEGVVSVEPTKETFGQKVYTCTVCNGTKIQVLDKLTESQIDRIAPEHLVSMRDHSYFAVDANEGTEYVDDEAAYNGKAVCFSKAKLAGFPGISINRYDVASGFADGAPEMRIANLSLSELKIDQGYRDYRFIYHVPESTTEGNTFYIMSNWQLNSAQFCKDFAACAGKTVEVYISMKITGPTADGFYSVFVDRVALATICEEYPSEDGLTCTLCGGSLVEEPEKLPFIFLAEDIRLPYAPTDSVVSDTKSQYGKAAMLSYKKRSATGDKGLVNSMIRIGTASLSMNTYNGKDSTLVGRITYNQLQKNAAAGKYRTYTFYNVPLISKTGSAYVYLFDCWGLQVHFTEKQLEALRGKRVDVSVSLRVSGDVSSTSNSPAYYIDCIQIAEASGKSCGHEDSTWTFVDDNLHNFACAICGKTWDSEHTWDEGVTVEGAPEGLKLYTCTGCKKSAVMGEDVLPAIFLADNFTVPYNAAFAIDHVVSDPDSVFGKAIRISYAERYATGDKGLYQHLLFTDSQALRVLTCDGSAGTPAGAIDGKQLRENAMAGKYVTYEFKDVDMTGAKFIYIFECWGLQVRFTEEQLSAMQGKLVNISVSMKVTGDPTGNKEDPAYYIDSIAFAISEKEPDHVHTCSEYTSVDENQHSCTCTECGEVLTENHKWNAGEFAKKATTEENGEILYTCTVCGATKTKIVEKLGGSSAAPVDDGGFISKEILTWAICVGVGDLAIVIFIIAMIKKRKKK